DKSLRTSLQRIFINYQEWARSNNIYHQFVKLASSIYGFVYRSTQGNYYIIINKNLTLELQKEVYLHEVEHIIYDMPDVGYIVGMDMQHCKIEKKANEFAKVVGGLFF
ncbi:MAG: hypothetical protein ACOC3B_02895, partial [Bacillota bacterium]